VQTSLTFAFGLCHALTAACLERVGGGEAIGLFVHGECIHSVYRAPHSPAYIDAFGATVGGDALHRCAERYVRPGDPFEWRRLDQPTVLRFAAGNNATRARQLISRAMPFAKHLLAEAP
jgi:hypothetical protein